MVAHWWPAICRGAGNFAETAKRALVSRFMPVDLAAGYIITLHCTISFRMHDLYDYDFAAPALISICLPLVLQSLVVLGGPLTMSPSSTT